MAHKRGNYTAHKNRFFDIFSKITKNEVPIRFTLFNLKMESFSKIALQRPQKNNYTAHKILWAIQFNLSHVPPHVRGGIFWQN